MFGVWNHSLDHLVHLLVAFVLALPIGWHRSREEQNACIRTFALVAMASCGVVQTAIYGEWKQKKTYLIRPNASGSGAVVAHP